jgi:hydrogenase expression/formation protein HypE
MRDKGKNILLAHGGGGGLTRRLIEDVFLRAFANPILAPLNDQAVLNLPGARLAFTTDSYVINPIFFPGGDIGKLSVCGTVNDLSVGGAEPLYLSASFIIEEGLPVEELKAVVGSMAAAATDAGVAIVTGDTKVVERGKGDRLFINTAGIGVFRTSVELSPTLIRPGDVVIVSGTIGDHGVAVLTHREGIMLEAGVKSDCAPLNRLTAEMMAASGASAGEGGGIRAMRDATRGGVATVLNEFASQAGCGFVIREESVPIRDDVRGACEILGFDPLYLANEGKLVTVVSKDSADAVLEAMRRNPLGANAAAIGYAVEAPKGKTVLETSIGNRRLIEMLSGEQLPRIC